MAARTISTTIKVDGENAFNNAMKSINSNLRVLKSALSATEAEFRSQSGSVTALSQKLKAQTNVYEQQKEKVRQLAQAVAESKVKYGENSAETDRLTTSYNRARAEMSNMEAEIKKTSQALSEAQTATQGMSGSMDELDASAENAAGGLNAWKVAAGSLLADLARKGAQIIKEVGQTGIEYNAQIEKYSTALTTALGDASKAAAAIEGIKQDAASTPYDMATLVQANSLLISTGEGAENARSTIMALSNAVSATGGGNDELNRMAYNLQQIKNLGKASAVDIKQFGNAGIDIFGVLADYTGKNTSEVKELTVTYELLSKALQAAAAEGGRYFGANAAQAATLNGQISTLKDNVKSKLGEAFAGASNMLSGTLLPAANRFVQSMDMGKIIADFDDLVTAAAAVGGAVAAIKLGGKIGSFADDMIASVAATRELAAEFGKAELTQAALGGEMKATQAATLLLTGGLDLATAKQMALNAAAAAFPGLLWLRE